MTPEKALAALHKAEAKAQKAQRAIWDAEAAWHKAKAAISPEAWRAHCEATGKSPRYAFHDILA